MSKTARAVAPSAITTTEVGPVSAPKPAPRQRRRARIDVDQGAAAKPAAKRTSKTCPAKPLNGSAAVEPKIWASIKSAPKVAKPAARSRTKTQPSKGLSALDAAAQVLTGLSKSDASTGITASDLIERMAKAKLWSSPGGKTPAATLYAAMIREITRKGRAARFVRVSPGHFAANRTSGKSGGRS